MLARIKTFLKQKPVLGIVLGGVVLFGVYLIIRQIFKRSPEQNNIPLNVLSPMPPMPPMPEMPPMPDIGAGEEPQWAEALILAQQAMLNQLDLIGQRLAQAGRNTHFVQEVIRGREERAMPTQPTEPVQPTRPLDHDLIRRLREDIARVEGRIGDAAVESWFKNQWGGIHNYLASQRNRLARALEGDNAVRPLTTQPIQPVQRGQPTEPVQPVQRGQPPEPIQLAQPARPLDHALIGRLREDIAKVEGRIGDAATESWFKRQWGGIQPYLASQRERLARALEGR